MTSAVTALLGPFGPLQMLDVQCFDGVVRRIDLASGLPLDAGGGQVPVRVVRQAPAAGRVDCAGSRDERHGGL